MNRAFSFFKNIIFLLFQPDSQLGSFFFLFFNLMRKDFKSALSIFFFSVESLASIYRYKRVNKQVLNLNHVKDEVVKESKTLFILGSGPTVNDYSKEEWDDIRANESWGFNLWFCHDFIPNVYLAQALIEPSNAIESSSSYKLNSALVEMLIDKKEHFNETKFYIRGDAVNKGLFYNTIFGKEMQQLDKNKVYHIAEIPVSSSNRISPKVLLTELWKQGFFEPKNGVQVIPKFGSTITELITLGLMMGYKKIVLCGIDMNNGGHFYDSDRYFTQYPYLKQLYTINHTRTEDGGHEHMDTSLRPYTIKDYILALREFAVSNYNADIFVMKESSKLFPEIDKYEKNN